MDEANWRPISEKIKELQSKVAKNERLPAHVKVEKGRIVCNLLLLLGNDSRVWFMSRKNVSNRQNLEGDPYNIKLDPYTKKADDRKIILLSTSHIPLDWLANIDQMEDSLIDQAFSSLIQDIIDNAIEDTVTSDYVRQIRYETETKFYTDVKEGNLEERNGNSTDITSQGYSERCFRRYVQELNLQSLLYNTTTSIFNFINSSQTQYLWPIRLGVQFFTKCQQYFTDLLPANITAAQHADAEINANAEINKEIVDRLAEWFEASKYEGNASKDVVYTRQTYP